MDDLQFSLYEPFGLYQPQKSDGCICLISNSPPNLCVGLSITERNKAYNKIWEHSVGNLQYLVSTFNGTWKKEKGQASDNLMQRLTCSDICTSDITCSVKSRVWKQGMELLFTIFSNGKDSRTKGDQQCICVCSRANNRWFFDHTVNAHFAVDGTTNGRRIFV